MYIVLLFCQNLSSLICHVKSCLYIALFKCPFLEPGEINVLLSNNKWITSLALSQTTFNISITAYHAML